MSQNPGQVLLALFAHPGDAEMLCGGTLLRMAELGWQLHIVAMTRGENASLTLPAATLAAQRQQEARASAAALGAAFQALDEPDDYITFDRVTLRRTVDLVRSLSPRIVITHARRDCCVDHEQVAQLARAACAVAVAPQASEVPFAAGFSVPHLYFADPLLGREPGGAIVNPSTVIRITRQHTAKLQAVSMHASLLEWAAAHLGIANLIDRLREHGIDRGRLAGAVAAEAFVQHLAHGLPGDDLLRELLLR